MYKQGQPRTWQYLYTWVLYTKKKMQVYKYCPFINRNNSYTQVLNFKWHLGCTNTRNLLIYLDTLGASNLTGTFSNSAAVFTVYSGIPKHRSYLTHWRAKVGKRYARWIPQPALQTCRGRPRFQAVFRSCLGISLGITPEIKDYKTSSYNAKNNVDAAFKGI